ncbi:MAG TPA: ABC transporter substrate-binding protein, partial [Firmicutes bacterium]|nr:ABC transporter substrate-binding protein [Bacillota bacterium]
PKVPPYPEVSSILQRYIHQALQMKLSPKEALDKAKAEIEAVLKKAK